MDGDMRNLERAAAQGDTVAAAKLARARRRAVASPETRAADVFASRVTSLLGSTWAAIRELHPELPSAVVVLASGTTQKVRRWGHWAASRWNVGGERAGEVLIAGELLAPGGGHDPAQPVEHRVLETLLHEAAHALAFVRSIEDTSRGGRYHNERYAVLGRELGLDVTRGPVHGWHRTQLRPETAAQYAQVLTDLREVLYGHRAPEAEGAEGGAGRARSGAAGGATRITIQCGCARRAQIAPGVLSLGEITCGRCGSPFEAV